MATRYGSEDHYRELKAIDKKLSDLGAFVSAGPGMRHYHDLQDYLSQLREAAAIRAALTKAERARRGRATAGGTGNDR